MYKTPQQIVTKYYILYILLAVRSPWLHGHHETLPTYSLLAEVSGFSSNVS